MNATLFRQAHVVNEGAVKVQDVLISGDRIVAVGEIWPKTQVTPKSKPSPRKPRCTTAPASGSCQDASTTRSTFVSPG